MKDLSLLKTHLYAHRGLHNASIGIYENTLAAFDEAIKHGFGIELDTNILKDGTVVVFHDKNLKRLCNVDVTLKDVTYDSIKDIKIMNTNETIHTLQEVLDYIDGKVPLMIEIKPFGDKTLHAKTVYELIKNQQKSIMIQSYNPYIVLWYKRNANTIIRGQISEFFKDSNFSFLTRWIMKTLITNKLTKPDFVNYGLKDIPNKYVDKQKKKGVRIIAYAAKNQESLDFMLEHCDNAVFEGFIPNKTII
ncbi:MAG: glycerophosphodiester phosphodiesterase family protein [Acholeplasma sp.]|nr:glycerophosphodiester phosphodiesterase family protein [Acholeplasma sp.]